MGAADAGRPLPRRLFLAGSAGAVAAGWLPWARLTAATADPACPPPPDFPGSIELYRQAYRNWVGEIRVDDAWTCAPQQPADVVALANWAHAHGYRLRPQGHAHSWAPLTVVPGTGCADRTLLVDTTRHLTGMQLVSADPAAVRVQTGAAMEDLLGFLQQAGYGLTATPAPGDLSVGGVLAVDGHGTAVPASGETLPPGHTYGSLSNLVTSLTAVVWDAATAGYQLRTISRSESDCAALLTQLGRAFLTDVTLRVGADANLRCVSDVTVPASELFAAPGTGAVRTLASYVEAAGRVEAIWFPFTAAPWLKVWSVSPTRPLTSRPAPTPYNYPFSDNVPEPVARLAGRIVTGEPELAPVFGPAQYDATVAGLAATASADLWGPSANLLLYVRPTTLRVTANGYAVLTRRADIQRVVSEFVARYTDLLAEYQAAGRFPVNGPVEIRVTGLDHPADVGVPGARPPGLSAVRPRPDHPEWTVAVWLDLLTLPATPFANEFYRKLEEFVLANYTGNYAAVRPEWSKGWAYTDTAAWANQTVLSGTIPAAYRQGPDPTWDATRATLDRLDPHRIYGNPFLDNLLP